MIPQYEYFVANNKLNEDVCLVFAYSATGERDVTGRPPPRLANLNVVNCDQNSGKQIERSFGQFLGIVAKRKEREDSGGSHK